MSGYFGFGGGFTAPSSGGSSTVINTTTVVTASELNFVTLLSQSAVPTPPTGSDVIVFNRVMAGLATPHMLISGNIMFPLGPGGGHSCRIMEYTPGNSTTAGVIRGFGMTQVGTLSHPALVATSVEGSTYRSRWTSGTTSGAAAGFITTVASLWRGDRAGVGGFYMFARWSTSTPNDANSQLFVGMAASYPAVEPSAITNHVAMTWDTTDSTSGPIYVTCRNATTGTRVQIPNSQRDTSLWDVHIHCPPAGAVFYVTCINQSSGTRFDTSFDTTFIPTATTFLNPGVTRNAGTSGVAQTMDCARFWVRANT